MRRVEEGKPDLYAVSFKDTKVVNMLTSVPPTAVTLTRWAKRERQYKTFTYPSTKTLYDTTMYGCDTVGQLCGYLKFKTRTPKWTQTVLFGKLRQSIAVQARTLYNLRFDKRLSVIHFTQMLISEFQRNIEKRRLDMLNRSPGRKRKRRTSVSSLMTPTSRRTPLISADSQLNLHWPARIPRGSSNSRRCRQCYKEGIVTKTTFFCQECEIFLCVPHAESVDSDCFRKFHTKQ